MSNESQEILWKKWINDSKCFFIIGTEKYFRNPTLFDQTYHASLSGKKFVVALEEGVEIPRGFPIPDNAVIFHWKDREDLAKKTKEAVRTILKKELSTTFLKNFKDKLFPLD